MSRVPETLACALLVCAFTAEQRGIVQAQAQQPMAANPEGDLPWMNASLSPETRAELLIARMTLAQKVQQISNDTRPARNPANRPRGCEFTTIGRHIQGIPELGIPTVRMINGGTGVRGGDCANEPVATAMPSTAASAATFNPELSRQLGDVLGVETRDDGHQVMLAPGMNLHRHPYGGRNYEYQSEDPYLSGVMAAATIQGIQARGIHAVAKHFAANEQEAQRRQMATVVPPRALHELYLLPFEMAVRNAQPAAVMCAFPEINGISACSNQDLLHTSLRSRWGFEGYVVSDRRAVHDLAPSIKAGVDWELSHVTPLHYSLEPQPGQTGNPGSEGIKAALKSGSITIADLDQMLRRRYTQMFKFGQFETNFDALYGTVPDFAAHGLVAREIAEQAIVLLKNQNNFLPLNANVRSIALIGATWFAGMAKMPPRSIRGDNTNVVAPYTVAPAQGLRNVLKALGSSATVTYASGGGTGTKSDRDAAVELAKRSDVVIVMVGDNPHELCDRETLGLPIVPPANPDLCGWDELQPGEYDLPKPPRGKGTDQEQLMNDLTAAAGVAQKMVVVLKTEGMVLMPWMDKVPALLEAWYPGQEDGNAVADILFGMRNPSGKLPMTFGTSEREAAFATPAQFPGLWVPPPHWLSRRRFSAQYAEGLDVGYRWHEANNVAPVFPFGFGLSYTTFAYNSLSVASSVDRQTGSTVLTVSYAITNTGTRQGAEASQVYLTLPPEAAEPGKRLVGFQKVDLMPGASQQVTVTIDGSASNHPLSYWAPTLDAPVPGWGLGTWKTASGTYTVHVGTSSADTPLQQAVTVAPPNGPAGTRPPNNFSDAHASDITVWRPDSGTWFISKAASNYAQSLDVQWGAGSLGDHPVAADYDGDGRSDVAVWRPSTGAWYIATSSTSFSDSFAIQWGAPGDWPLPGDFDGDGKADLAVWRPSNGFWSVLTSSSGYKSFFVVRWGALEQHDVPVPGDFDGDGRMDLAVWRPGSGTWFIKTSTSGYADSFAVQWGAGLLGDVPIVGDFDGDGRADIAVWRPAGGVWFIKASSTGYESSFSVAWGSGSLKDVPVVADFDRDGRSDIAVWRPADGVWYVKTSSSGYSSTVAVPWGSGRAHDQPIGSMPSQPAVPSSTSAQLLTIDAAHVGAVRDSLRRGETQFVSALLALETDANRALHVAPVSVMDKGVTPPSGDKHDYMSQAPYWWPDPSKPAGLPYIRRDGERNPQIDRITDRRNLQRLTDAVFTLALAFHFTDREEYADHAAQLVRVWFVDPSTRMNPNLKFGQGIPGRADGRAAGIVETRFLPEIIDGVTLLQRSPPWSGSDDAAFTAWLREYLTWLLESPLGKEENRRGNNQETWYDVQVAALAIHTGQPAVARTNFEDATTDIREEFEPDGRQPRELARTRAWDYSVFNLMAFVELAALAARTGVDLWNFRTADGRSLRKGIDFLIPFATRQQRFPYKQIGELRPALLYSILRLAAAGLDEPRYRDVAQQIGGGTPRFALTHP